MREISNDDEKPNTQMLLQQLRLSFEVAAGFRKDNLAVGHILKCFDSPGRQAQHS
jgi:hypothetical protein